MKVRSIGAIKVGFGLSRFAVSTVEGCVSPGPAELTSKEWKVEKKKNNLCLVWFLFCFVESKVSSFLFCSLASIYFANFTAAWWEGF